MFNRLNFQRRSQAAGIHLLISGLLAAAAGILVFDLWYPGKYRILSGGTNIFLLMICIDVVLGPVLTFLIFNLNKSLINLRRDLVVIGVLQLSALLYGINVVYQARPIAIVFEVDRFRVISAAQVLSTELSSARTEYRRLPITGPWMLGTRRAKPGDERDDALFMGAQGIDIAQRPLFWQPYSDSISDVLSHARPLNVLFSRYPSVADKLTERLRELRIDQASTRFIPVMAQSGDWIGVINSSGQLIDYIQVDGFF